MKDFTKLDQTKSDKKLSKNTRNNRKSKNIRPKNL